VQDNNKPLYGCENTCAVTVLTSRASWELHDQASHAYSVLADKAIADGNARLALDFIELAFLAFDAGQRVQSRARLSPCRLVPQVR
jgi:hypothetical protein